MKKIILSIFIVVFSLFSISGCSDNIIKINSEDFNTVKYKTGLEINHYSGKNSQLDIPDTINGKKVLKIGGFYEESSYKGAFKDCECKSICIPASVTEIENAAFSSAPMLERIEVDKENKNYTSIDGLLYTKDKKILLCIPLNYGSKDFEIPKGTISAECLIYNGLENLTIPKSLKFIDIKYSFPAWYYSSDKVIDYQLKNIFVESGNRFFKSENGLLYSKNGKELLIYPENNDMTDFTVPKSVVTIKKFYINTLINLKKLTVGNNVKNIELEADYDYDLADPPDPKYHNLTIIGNKNSEIYKWYKSLDENDYLSFRQIK